MAHTIVVASVKGGSGKTTTTLNLSVALAERGRSVVMIDLDPQGSIGLALAQKDTEWAGLAEYLMKTAPLENVVLKTKMNGLSILPRGRLNAVDVCEFEKVIFDSDALTVITEKLSSQYDYILMDTPSGLGMITRAAMRVCTHLLTTFQAEPMALRSVSQLLRVIEHVKKSENPNLTLLGILPTMVNMENDASMGVMNTVWSGFGGILDTYVPRADIFLTASEAGVPVDFLPGKKRPEARRFEKLSMEIEILIAQLGDEAAEGNERVQRKLV